MLDAFLWRFGNPFYRQTLGALYFGAPEPKANEAIAADSDSKRSVQLRHQTWAFGGVAFALIALVLAHAISPRIRAIEGSLVDPIHSQKSSALGYRARATARVAATKLYLSEPLKRNPANVDAQTAPLWVQTQESPVAVVRPSLRCATTSMIVHGVASRSI